MKKLLALLLCFCMVLPLASCQAAPGPAPTPEPEIEEPAATPSTEVENLEKLCKVWGYTKYRHPVFLKGEKDWDAELLALIPQVRKAKTSEDVNTLLYNWFVGLGEVENRRPSSLPDDLVIQADTAWTQDAEYLGQPLVDSLAQIKTTSSSRSNTAPVFLHPETGGMVSLDFRQEKAYETMDHSDPNYCLLGLFRMWNAIEYYDPYLDILDENWHDQLATYIPKMLEDNDQHSYELTLASLSTKLQDAHAIISGSWANKEFGKYLLPVELTFTEGKPVISYITDESCPLKVGDVLLAENGISIDEVIADRKQYISITDDQKLINPLGAKLICSHEEMMSVSVLRDGQELTFDVLCTGAYTPWVHVTKSHEILDNNLGLINPDKLDAADLPVIMEELKDTDGLIIDLRQYPLDPNFGLYMATYLVETYSPALQYANPYPAVPGAFLPMTVSTGKHPAFHVNYFYTPKVVLLINERTQSRPEFAVMCLRNDPKVTVIGSNSVGADGDVAYIPLPGDLFLCFTAHGIYHPDGGQTQRIGLSPDVEVRPTIQGIKEGRDELMEAAVQYLKDNQ